MNKKQINNIFRNAKSKRLLIVALSTGAMLLCEDVNAGGGASRVVTGIVVGTATGGVGLALGATTAAAVTAGVTTAVATASGGNVRAGVNVNGNGQFTGVHVDVTDNHGHQFANIDTEQPQAPTFNQINDCDLPRTHELFRNWSVDTIYDTINVNGSEYCRAKHGTDEFLILSIGRSFDNANRDLIGTQCFANQPLNFTFESTPYTWFFDKVMIDGRCYDHAWSDSLMDFLVPEGVQRTIYAPEEFVKSWKTEQELKQRQAGLYPSSQDEFIEALQRHSYSTAQMYFNETIWSTLNVERSINANNYTEAQTYADAALRYYDKAIEALKPVGYFIDDVLEEMVTPGGIENLRKYRNGEISAQDYDLTVHADIAFDAAAASLGSIIGGSTAGAAGAVVGGPAGAIAGATAGSAQGAAAGYIASRATKAVARASVSFLKTGENSNGDRVQAERQDADNYLKELKDKGVLSEKKIAKDGREYFKFQKKCEYNGIKFKKEQYIERDTMHNEWEWFGKDLRHKGAIDPLTGEIRPNSAVPGRKLHE